MKRFFVAILVACVVVPCFALKTVNSKRVPEGTDWSTFGVSPKYQAIDTLLTSLANILPNESTVSTTISTTGAIISDSAYIDTLTSAKATITNAVATTATITTLNATGISTINMKFDSVIVNTDASETVAATQSGALIVCSNASGASTVTIPDASAATVGVVYYIIQTANQNLVVTATTADNNDFVCDGVATSDSVAISTSSHLIGAGMVVIGISATQWYVGGLNPEAVLTPEAAD